MYKPTIKATYHNNYAIVYDIGIVLFGSIKYKWLLIATADGVVYDTVILPPTKYKQTKQAFTIYHTDGEPEVFYIVNTNTP